MTWTPDEAAVERARVKLISRALTRERVSAAIVAAVGELIDDLDIEIEGAMNDRAAMRKERDELRAELERARETMGSLNRRAQAAESAARETVEGCRKAGVSFGRGLANWAASDAERRCAELSAELERVKRGIRDAIIAERESWSNAPIFGAAVHGIAERLGIDIEAERAKGGAR